MAKELGEQLTKTQLYKISNNFYITRHARDRFRERNSDLFVENDLAKTLSNINYAIRHCKFAYNNNDNSVSVVLDNEQCIVLSYDDKFKVWNIITIKDKSANGIDNETKWEMSKMKTIKDKHKCKWENRMNEKETSVRYPKKHQKPYKREKFNWREY